MGSAYHTNICTALKYMLEGSPFEQQFSTTDDRHTDITFPMRPAVLQHIHNLPKTQAIYLSKAVYHWLSLLEDSNLPDKLKSRIRSCTCSIGKQSSLRFCNHKLCIFCRVQTIQRMKGALDKLTFPVYARTSVKEITPDMETLSTTTCTSALLRLRDLKYRDGGFQLCHGFVSQKQSNRATGTLLISGEELVRFICRFLRPSFSIFKSDNLTRWLNLTKNKRLFDLKKGLQKE